MASRAQQASDDIGIGIPTVADLHPVLGSKGRKPQLASAKRDASMFNDVVRKKLGQESEYEGYTKLEEPFTSTDTYNYVDAFFMGL